MLELPVIKALKMKAEGRAAYTPKPILKLDFSTEPKNEPYPYETKYRMSVELGYIFTARKDNVDEMKDMAARVLTKELYGPIVLELWKAKRMLFELGIPSNSAIYTHLSSLCEIMSAMDAHEMKNNPEVE